VSFKLSGDLFAPRSSDLLERAEGRIHDPRSTTKGIPVSRFILSLFFALHASAAFAGTPDDPLKSPAWPLLAKRTFGDAPIVFDERVKVIVPSIVEDQTQAPITVDARGIDGVEKLVVIADLNPIQHVVTLIPISAAPYISLRMKVEQGTPVRAAALTSDGVWRLGGVYLDAAGGGCTAPAMARKDADWTETVGRTQGRLWRETGGLTRARFRMRHPMDTGLAKNVSPAFYIERLALKGSGGSRLATIESFEPLSEDPTLTLLVRLPSVDAGLDIEGRDNNGRVYRASLPAPVAESALAEKTAPVR